MRNIFLIILTFLSISIWGQNSALSFSYGVGRNFMIQDKVHRTAQYDGEVLNVLDLRYSQYFGRKRRRNAKRFGVEIGASYSAQEYWAISSDSTYLEKSNLLYFPVYAKMLFHEYLYLSGGLIYTLDLSYQDNFRRSKQNGIGAGVEFGGNYKFNKKWDLIFAIFARQHNLFPFTKYYTYEAMLEVGIKVGIELKI